MYNIAAGVSKGSLLRNSFKIPLRGLHFDNSDTTNFIIKIILLVWCIQDRNRKFSCIVNYYFITSTITNIWFIGSICKHSQFKVSFDNLKIDICTHVKFEYWFTEQLIYWHFCHLLVYCRTTYKNKHFDNWKWGYVCVVCCCRLYNNREVKWFIYIFLQILLKKN